jgi:hypothetical protein
VPRAELQKARAAFAAARGLRACASYIALTQDMQWGVFEYAAPDRRRWHMRRGRDAPGAPPANVLEVVQVGAEAWLRRDDGPWSQVEAGRTPKDAVGKGDWLPDPNEILGMFFDKDPKLMRSGAAEASARTGASELWSLPPPHGIWFYQTLYVGPRDRRPYRVAYGGPGSESYTQLEIYDYDAPVAIEPPR